MVQHVNVIKNKSKCNTARKRIQSSANKQNIATHQHSTDDRCNCIVPGPACWVYRKKLLKCQTKKNVARQSFCSMLHKIAQPYVAITRTTLTYTDCARQHMRHALEAAEVRNKPSA